MSHPLIACTNIKCCFMSPHLMLYTVLARFSPPGRNRAAEILSARAAEIHFGPSFSPMGRNFSVIHVYCVTEIRCSCTPLVNYNQQHLMFVHAISGCDTVSAPYMKGKKRALEVLRSYGDQDSFFEHVH